MDSRGDRIIFSREEHFVADLPSALPVEQAGVLAEELRLELDKSVALSYELLMSPQIARRAEGAKAVSRHPVLQRLIGPLIVASPLPTADEIGAEIESVLGARPGLFDEAERILKEADGA